MKHRFFFLVISIILISSLTIPPKGETNNDLVPEETSWEIEGIKYTAKKNTFSENGDFHISLNDTFEELVNTTKSKIQKIGLVKSRELVDIYYRIRTQEIPYMSERLNKTYEEWLDNKSYSAYFGQFSEIAARFDPVDITNGFAEVNLTVIENYGIFEAEAITIDEDFLGNIPVNSSRISYRIKS